MEFIQYAVEYFDVYWLTTHCMHGDPVHAVEYLQRGSDVDLAPWLNRIKPTTWSLKKTEGIDLTKPFLWFDDDCFMGEKFDLQEHAVLDSWIEINLRRNPDQMEKEIITLQAYSTAER